jgi:hypothetical protein
MSFVLVLSQFPVQGRREKLTQPGIYEREKKLFIGVKYFNDMLENNVKIFVVFGCFLNDKNFSGKT